MFNLINKDGKDNYVWIFKVYIYDFILFLPWMHLVKQVKVTLKKEKK